VSSGKRALRSSGRGGRLADDLKDGNKLQSRCAQGKAMPNGVLKSQIVPQMEYDTDRI
jgi:hypothetical protein